MSYDQNPNHTFLNVGDYNVTLTVQDNQSNIDEFYEVISVTYDFIPPRIKDVSYDSGDLLVSDFNVTIIADIVDDCSGVKTVCVNISYPDDKGGNFTMTNIVNDTYRYIFNDTWKSGNYSYRVWAVDNENNSNVSETFSFFVPPVFGYLESGASYEVVDDLIVGSVFTVDEYCTTDSITAFINTAFGPPGDYKCMIYRANDSKLIGTTVEDYNVLQQGNPGISSWWAEFNFSDPKPVLESDTEYVLACWGSNSYCRLYYDLVDDSIGRYDSEVYGVPPDPADFSNNNRLYSIYCSFTPEQIPPEITNVTSSPDLVGFGYNISVFADVTDNKSGVDTVSVNITYPDDSEHCFTMENTVGDTFSYVFSDSWIVGCYNFSIWAIDEYGNQNTSLDYCFNVSANATINIATLQDTYGTGEYINITDPPNPSENYILTSRGLTYNKYYDAESGNDVLEVYTGPVNYMDEYRDWTPINTSIELLEPGHPVYGHGYRAGNNKGLYSTYFKPNIQDNWPIVFAYDKSENPNNQMVCSKLVGMGYLDPSQDWNYEYIRNTQSSTGHVDDCSIIYDEVFTGTDIRYIYDASGLKEEIIMDTSVESMLLDNPPSDYGLNNNESYLVFITRLDFQGLTMYDEYGELSDDVTITENGVDFKDAVTGEFKCGLPLGTAYEQNNPVESKKLIYRIINIDGDYYLLSGLKYVDLQEMSFPVVVDPTISVYSTNEDGHIYRYSNLNYNTAWTSSTGTVYDTSSYIYLGQKREPLFPTGYVYRIYRGFLFFNTSYIPTNACITNATVSLTKGYDYSDNDFDIVIQNGQPSYPHDPLESGDYDKDYYSGDGGSFNTSDFTSGRNNITVTNLSWITKEGLTKLCLRSSRDIDGVAPTGLEYVLVRSANYVGTLYDPKLVVEYRNQSKIKNTGSVDICGFLFMRIDFYEGGKEWIVDQVVVDEETVRTVGVGEQLALDLIFNGLVSTDDLENGDGCYRVYAAFRDEYGDVLVCDDESLLEVSYEFEVATS